MAEVDSKVMMFVEQTLKKTPKIELEELFARAKEVSAAMGKLTKRQFNARYPLQVKRRAAQGKTNEAPAKSEELPAKGKEASAKKSKPGKGRTRQGRTGGRQVQTGMGQAVSAEESRVKIRKVLLQFATDITGAEERKDLVKVLAGVDKYVDQVLKGLGQG